MYSPGMGGVFNPAGRWSGGNASLHSEEKREDEDDEAVEIRVIGCC